MEKQPTQPADQHKYDYPIVREIPRKYIDTLIPDDFYPVYEEENERKEP